MATKSIELIVARDKVFGLGLDGKIPWRCKYDMEHFKAVTTKTVDSSKKNAVIMGRRTWDSLKNKPLKDRVNICLSSSPQQIVTCGSMKAAIDYSNENPLIEKIFIIGGERVYKEALETLRVDRIWMTIIKREFPTDRDVRFIGKFIKNYKRNEVICDCEEFIIWKYECLNDPKILPKLRS